MNITNTKANKEHSLVELLDGVFLKTMPMSGMQDYFKCVDEQLEANPKETIDKLFDDLIRESDGSKFDDLIDSKASDVIPLETIKAIIDAIPGAIVPDPK